MAIFAMIENDDILGKHHHSFCGIRRRGLFKKLFWIRPLWVPNFEASFFVFVFLFAIKNEPPQPSVIICCIKASPSECVQLWIFYLHLPVECQSWRRSSGIRKRWECSTALALWFLKTPCGLFRNCFLRPLSNLCPRVLFTEARGKSVEPVWLPRL